MSAALAVTLAHGRSASQVVLPEVEPLSGAPTPAYVDGIADVVAEFPRP